jgi:LacI family repressor for deo operon, udp, cdd, tsx, nupC, and nupG
MKGRNPATIKDIAAELGLSIATVSRALTRPKMLRPETVRRVLETAERLGYQPNLAARDLKTRRTGVALVVVPSLHPFFLEVLRGAERAARETGYTVVMGHSDREPEREEAFFDQVASGRADGIILVSSAAKGTIAMRKRKFPPVVAALEEVEGRNFPTVRVNHAAAAAEATSLLINLGHRRIAHILGPRRSPMAQHRREGFLSALAAAGIKDGAQLCVQGDSSTASGEAATEQLLTLARRPTAIFAANDEMAVGAIRAARRAGLRVPEDLSVVGFNDQGLAEIYDPPLTTISIPTCELGYRAMLKLKSLLAGEQVARDEILPTEFILRATTAPPPKLVR